MKLTRILSDLRAERQRVEEAMSALERLARAGGKRRRRRSKRMVGQQKKRSAGRKAAKGSSRPAPIA